MNFPTEQVNGKSCSDFISSLFAASFSTFLQRLRPLTEKREKGNDGEGGKFSEGENMGLWWTKPRC